METLAWIAMGFMLGSLPFAYWVGRVVLRKDIRKYGDGNPGATNVFNAGGAIPYILAVLLDAMKAALPVWLAQEVSHLSIWQLSLVAVAPMVGNAFSPFLRFRGGTGVAVLYGAWLGLTGWIGPVVIAASFSILFIFIRETPWCVLLGMILFLGFLLAGSFSQYLALAWIGHEVIMGYNRRQYFTRPPKLQKWLTAFAIKTPGPGDIHNAGRGECND